jgi:(1->4)-alpha-D-glucan 1-alpha-D-glucosylmutase
LAGPASKRKGAHSTWLAAAPVPRATYRVQLNREFRFADATALVPYLASLGISHLYCSPYLRARPGSRHGYDIVDHTTLNPEIGTREDFDALVAALARHGMSHVCDVVPNHMAIMGEDNAWWMDVLENGPASSFSEFFDIDWKSSDPDLYGKVLVPILGESYGTVLERGELELQFEADTGAFAIRYFDHRLPLDPRECAPIVELAIAAAAERIEKRRGEEAERLVEALRALPARTDVTPEALAARRSDAPMLERRLAELAAATPPLADAIRAIVARHNGTPGEPASFEALDRLLEGQAFRLAYWRVAGDEINYRRFFDVNELASLRMEDERIFDATHRFVLELAAEGRVGALRIDHPDGLSDPAAYFERLQSRYRELAARHAGVAYADQPGIYLAIEKISAPHERLPADWPVHGDTGYPFANAIIAVLVDPKTKARVDRVWRAFVGDEARDFETAAYEGRRAIMRGPLAAGLNRLVSQALAIGRADWHTRDLTASVLREALTETIAWFPVYRTYVSPRGVSAQDRRYIDWAVARARRASRVADPSVFDFLRSLLLATPPEGSTRSLHERYLDFAMRFAQFTAPVAAKGVEDTSFYTHTRFIAANDVGGDPQQFGMTRRAFHRISADRSYVRPHTMLATSTHDNKRSEDVRARIAVISELPAAWRLTVRRWSRMNRTRRQALESGVAPSRSDEYYLYQTLAGSSPPTADSATLADYRERIAAHAIKAAREAKRRTSWLRIDADYEAALAGFVNALLADGGENRFLDDLRAQSGVFAWFGMLNSLTATLVKLASPGVPDIYQGNEILDYSLVDPDNRRAVDYDARRTALASLETLEADAGTTLANRLGELFASPYDGRAKLWIVYRMLSMRRRDPKLFEDGSYRPLPASGSRSRNVLTFARVSGDRGIAVVAGRLFASLGLSQGEVPIGARAWGDTVLDAGIVPAEAIVTDVISGAQVQASGGAWPLSTVLAHFPGAVLSWGVVPEDGSA